MSSPSSHSAEPGVAGRGAEAIVHSGTLLSWKTMVKERIPKRYRIREIDERLRIERTRSEARLLHKAKLAGVRCPTVLEVGKFTLTLGKIEGKRPEMDGRECDEAGRILARLHKADIIHGDYTQANLIKDRFGICVIDFGLGFISKDIEDKAVDVFTMLRALGSKEAKDGFVEGYSRCNPDAKRIMDRAAMIEKRVRYAV